MKKAKLLSILMPLFALGALSGCKPKEEEGPVYSYDKTYHWVEGAEADKARHDYEDEPEKTVLPTCAEKGKTYELCKVCGYEKETPKNALDHELIEDTEKSVPSTCSVAGKKVEKCKNCSFTTTTDLEKTSHTFGEGVSKTDSASRQYKEYECSICHTKTIKYSIKFNSFNSTNAPSASDDGYKLASSAGKPTSWNVSLEAGEYEVYFSAKYSSTGVGYSLDGRGIAVKYNDTEVEFDSSLTEEDLGLSTTEYKEFSFFKITATGGQDVLSLENPYYRFVFEGAADITFVKVAAKAQ